jgi:hypothetical protein
MSTLFKSAALSLTVLAGLAFTANAQQAASLPPAAPAASQPLAPMNPYPGPNPGAGGTAAMQTPNGPVAQSPGYVGPAPGGAWYGKEQQSQAVQPSGAYPGPRPN